MRKYSTRIAAIVLAVIIAACQGQTPGVVERAGDGTYPFRGSSECSEDVTRALNDFFAAVPDGSTVTFAPNGCYRITGTVLVTDKYDLTLEGNGAEFAASEEGDIGRRHWSFQGGGGFAVRNLAVRGVHAAGGPDGYVRELEGQHGFNLAGVDGAVFTNVTIRDVYGDFIRLDKDKRRDAKWSRNITVTQSRLEGSGRQGVTVAAASDVRIEGNTIRRVARSVFDIEPNGENGGAARVRFSDNDVSDWGNLVLPIGGKGSVSDVELVNNQLHGKWLEVLVKEPRLAEEGDGLGERRANVSIVGNVSDTASDNVIVNLSGVDGAVVTGNVQPFEAGSDGPALRVRRSCRVVVEDNVFTHVAQLVESDQYVCP